VRTQNGGRHRPHLASDGQEHLGVGDHYDQRRGDEGHCGEDDHENSAPMSHVRDESGRTKMRLGHSDVGCGADRQTQRPDGADGCSEDAVGEDGEVRKWTNNYATLDDRHCSQMPDGTRGEVVLTAVGKL